MEPLEHVGAGAGAGDSISGEHEHAINPTMLRLVLSHLNYSELEPAAKEYFERDFEAIHLLNDRSEREKFAQLENLLKPFEKYLSDENKKRLNEIRELLNKKDTATDTFIPIYDFVDRTRSVPGQHKKNYDLVTEKIGDFCEYGLMEELPAAIMKSPNWKNEIPKFFELLQFIPFSDRERSHVFDNICQYSSQFIFGQMPKNEKGDYAIEIETGNKITSEKVRSKYFRSLFLKMYRDDFNKNPNYKNFSDFKPLPKHISDIIGQLLPEDRSFALERLIYDQISSLLSIKKNKGVKQIRGSEIETEFTRKLEEILNSIRDPNLEEKNKESLLRGIELYFPEFRDRVAKVRSEVIKRAS